MEIEWLKLFKHIFKNSENVCYMNITITYLLRTKCSIVSKNTFLRIIPVIWIKIDEYHWY